jgi:antitoxin component YwqK of YwqJK toxin-antitoxin module
MKTTKLAVKIALFILYLLIFVISIIITLFYFGMNYNEVNTIKQMDNKSIYYNQIYIFGKLNSEIPIDDNEYFNGEAIMYSSVDSSILKNKYYYENGFRTGVWYEYDNSGELKEIREYNNGKLVYIELYRNGAAKKIMFNEMGVLKKIVEEISRLSLPRKSLASKFK